MFAARVQRLAQSLCIHATVSRVGAVTRLALSSARQTICALRGHERVLHFEPERLSLECLACGARTEGWTIEGKPVCQRVRQQVPRLDVRHRSGIPLQQYASSRRLDAESAGVRKAA